MATPKRRLDFLGTECELGGLPIPDFQATFCVRCSQPECTRSQYGKSSFDQRVSTWESRLFTQVPRMDPTDPRYKAIASKNFRMIDVGPAPSVSSRNWIDVPSIASAAPVPVPVVTAPAPPEDEAPDTDRSPPMSSPSEVQAPPRVMAEVVLPPAPQVPRNALRMNTPVKPEGQMLPGAKPQQSPPPKKDPWAAPEPSKEQVLKPGARVKIGGGV
jgi:hypothetical protein